MFTFIKNMVGNVKEGSREKLIGLNNHINEVTIYGFNRNKVVSAAYSASLLSLLPTSSFAEGASIGGVKETVKKLVSALKQVRGQLVILGVAIAGVAVVVCGMIMAMSKDEKKVASAKEWLKRILLSVCLMIVTVMLITTFGKFAESLGDQNDKIDGWN